MGKSFRTYALLTFVTDVEKEQMLSLFDWEVFYLKNDNGTYYRAFIERDGDRLPVVAVGQKEKGSIASATLVMKCIDLFRPEYVISGGIAAGVAFKHKNAQMEIGDVVISDSTWNLSKGKYTDSTQTELNEGGIGYIPRPNMTSIHPDTRKLLKRLSKSSGNPVRTHIGTYLTSGSVIANSHFMEKAILSSNLIAKALDMESFGIAYACEMADSERPIPIIAKGISDFADEKKSDAHQSLAAENSAVFIKYLLMNLPADIDLEEAEQGKSNSLFSTLHTAGRSLRNFIERKANDTVKLQQMKKWEKELDFLARMKANLNAPVHYENGHLRFDTVNLSDNTMEFGSCDFRQLNEDVSAVNMASPIGKGIPSCILVSAVQSCFDAFMDSETTLRDYISKTNQFLSSSNLMHSLFESWTCIIDKRDSSIHYINAGHPDPFIIRNDGSVEEIADGQNNPKLGLKDINFKESQMRFMPGESLFLFSSGIEDCRDVEGEVFGRKRLRMFLQNNTGKETKDISQSLKQSLVKFCGKESTDRDWTMLRIDHLTE